MSNQIHPTAGVRLSSMGTGESAACADCGGLKCLCRPRFFAGQLLSEEDLNRLDCYIIEKHKLHNRHLHGWGVACGLEVRCDPCVDSVVTVTPGYALSPCGEDIVVCEKDTVPVCELIKECREKERSQDPCRPYGYSPDCPDEEEDWVLSIRYDERPERGITALRHVGSCCHSSDAKGLKRRDAPAQCEPAVLCETYRYEVFRAPDQDPGADDKLKGDMADRMLDCLDALIASVLQLPQNEGDDLDQHAWYIWCCEVKRGLGGFFLSHPVFNCQYRRELDCIVCPDPNLAPETFKEALGAAWERIVKIVIEAVFDCVCSALLPPCAESTDDPRVPLAVISIRNGDCHIFRVCNWTVHRKFLTTFPNLQYWLSWLPYGRLLREYLQSICCEPFRLFDTMRGSEGIRMSRNDTDQPFANPAGAGVSSDYHPGHARPSRNFSNMAFKAFARQPLDAETLFRGVMGKKDAQGRPILDDMERANLPQFLLINRLVRSLGTSMLPEQASELFKNLGEILTGAPGREEEINTLKSLVQEMEEKLSEQGKRIEELNKLLKK